MDCVGLWGNIELYLADYLMIDLTDDQFSKLAKLIERRRVKNEFVELLALAKKAQVETLTVSERKPISASKDQNYSKLLRQLIQCVEQKLLNEQTIVEILSGSEIAGNQHVMLFEVPQPDKKDKTTIAFLDFVASPKHQRNKAETLAEFIAPPKSSHCRILSKSDDEVTVKFVSERNYWLVNELAEGATLDRRLFERLRQRERSAIVLKVSISKGLIQVRVPPTEKGGIGSASSHYEFARDTIASHYPHDWFSKLKSLPITDAFPTLVNDDDTLVSLWADSPEDDDISSRIKNQGRPNISSDLRKNTNWKFKNGYARTSLYAYFRCAEQKTSTMYARLHADKLRKAGKGTLARLFVPRSCKDEELEDAIARIRKHV